MTVYNGEVFLREALDAILQQTYTDFELIVVNNGSTDGTQDILDSIDDPRLRVVHPQRHGSVGDGLRLAYRSTVGRYIAVQDADDVSTPDRFAKQIAAIEADDGLGLVSSAYRHIDVNGNDLDVMRPPTDSQKLRDVCQYMNPLAHSTFMFNRVATDGVQGYPKDLSYGSDFGLVLSLLHNGWGIKVIDEILLKLRIHDGQASAAPRLNVTRLYEAVILFRQALKLPDISPKARAMGWRNLTKKTILYALALFSEGQGMKGLVWIGRAISIKPLYAIAYLSYRLMIAMGLIRPAV